jgi:hypothetical protein
MMVRLAYDVTEVVMNCSVPGLLQRLYLYWRRWWRTTTRTMAKCVPHYNRSVMLGQFEAALCDSQSFNNSSLCCLRLVSAKKGEEN